MGRTLAFALLTGGVLLAGCSAVAAPVATPSETAETATPEQIASVIAENQAEWRDVAEKARECRVLWVISSQLTFSQKSQAQECFTAEQSIGETAFSSYLELDAFTVPSSMGGLVDKTKVALKQIADTNVGWTVCGSEELPDLNDKCVAALGTRYAAYPALVKALDAWSPYL